MGGVSPLRPWENAGESCRRSCRRAGSSRQQNISARVGALPPRRTRLRFGTEHGSSSESNSKTFQPKLLRATVVLQWDGVPAQVGKEVVLLTSDPADDLFVAFDAYDDRSLIENECNREAKEHWFLEHHPKRTEAGMRVHAYFVFFCMALVAAFRLYKAKTDAAERRGQDTGIARYRRQLEMYNRDKVVVFVGEFCHPLVRISLELGSEDGLAERRLPSCSGRQNPRSQAACRIQPSSTIRRPCGTRAATTRPVTTAPASHRLFPPYTDIGQYH